MTGKRIQIGARPTADPTAAESWVRQGDSSKAIAHEEAYTARLTIDVTPAMRGRIKITAFRQSTTVADMLRALLEREFPDEEHGDG